MSVREVQYKFLSFLSSPLCWYRLKVGERECKFLLDCKAKKERSILDTTRCVSQERRIHVHPQSPKPGRSQIVAP